MKPKVSVIIPVYNVEAYIEKCLDSLLSQTLDDIEIICVNDGSTDKSCSIILDYVKKDSRIILMSQENKGPGCARNAGLRVAKGEYVGFVDPDDFLDFDFFEKLYNCAIKNDIDIVKGNVKILQDEVQLYSEENFAIKKEKRSIPLKNFRACWWAAIYKNDNIDKYEIRFSDTFYLEDVAFLDKNLLVARSFKFIDDVYYYHCIRKNSLTTKKTNSDFKLKQFYLSYKDIKNFLNCVKSKDVYKYYINETFYYHIIWFFMNIYLSESENTLDNYKYIESLLEDIDMSIFKNEYRKNIQLILSGKYDKLYNKIKNKKQFKFIDFVLSKNNLYLVIDFYIFKFKFCIKRGYYG